MIMIKQINIEITTMITPINPPTPIPIYVPAFNEVGREDVFNTDVLIAVDKGTLVSVTIKDEVSIIIRTLVSVMINDEKVFLLVVVVLVKVAINVAENKLVLGDGNVVEILGQ